MTRQPCRWAMLRMLLAATVCAGAAGCRHKPQPVAISVPPPSPVPLEPAPQPKTPPLIASVPTQPVPLPPVALPREKKAKKMKRAVMPAPVQMASVAPAAPLVAAAPGGGPAANVSVIGALTAGGTEAPETHQKAVDLIASVDKRLAALPAEFKEKEKDELLRVVNFQRQAQSALGAGDSEGAVTLATKAKLLLDDLQK